MASFGFEFEFPALGCRYFDNGAEIPGQYTIFTISPTNALGQILYKITTDMMNANGYRIIEAISVYPNIGHQANNGIFDGLTAFINEMQNQLNNAPGANFNKRFVLNGGGGNILLPGGNFTLTPTFNPVRNLIIIKRGPTNMDLAVMPQFTFGFNNNPVNDENESVLERFYRHFNPLHYYPDISNLFQNAGGILSRAPYSTFSRLEFSTNLPGGDLWRQERWALVEFLKFYIACTLRNNINPNDGNKNYTPIMSRVQFRDGILNFVLDPGELSDRLINYITNSYIPAARAQIPFNTLYPNKMIAIEYGAKNVVDGIPNVNINNQINNAYLNNLNLNVLLSNLLILDGSINQIGSLRQAITFNLRNTLIANLAENEVASPEHKVTRSSNNIMLYDFLSPVPYSLNSDSLGYYSRDEAIVNVPRFLFEIRYAIRFLEDTHHLPAGNAYNLAFQNACIHEFGRAVIDWQ